MTVTLTIAFLVTLGGAVATYLYDDKASFGARLCSGACLGLGALGLVGFVVASFIGLTDHAVVISLLVTTAPLLMLLPPSWRKQVHDDVALQTNSLRRFFNSPVSVLYVGFYLAMLIVFLKVFSRAMMVDSTGMSTGDYNNFGDLPFHISVITGF